MKIKELDIAGCYQITPNIFTDERGLFIKTFHDETFQKYGINLELKEEFYSISKKNVLRGLHFQSQPSAHNKLVYCPQGSVLDFIVDVRKNSPTYGEHLTINLNENNGLILYLPIGIAHGFLSLEDNTLMIYKTDCSYDPLNDGGVNFKSFDIKLPIDKSEIIISDKDNNLISFEKYNSDFIYG